MNREIQTQFDRMEAALDTLIKSITSYNPSPAAAISVVEADDDLSHSLHKLAIHQHNYQKLQVLRTTSEALDNRLKTTLANLAETRNELIKRTPVSLPSQDQKFNPIEAGEVLDFAQRIARSTVPPTDHLAVPSFVKVEAPTYDENGRMSPQFTTQGSDGTQQMQANDTSKAVTTLSAELKAWLEPDALQKPFTPWPNDESIRRGALMQIEGAWERPDRPNPADIDLVAEAEANDERLKSEAAEAEAERLGVKAEG